MGTVTDYNLGQNKIRNKTTPRQINDELALNSKCAISPIIEMGEGVVLIFHLNCPRL